MHVFAGAVIAVLTRDLGDDGHARGKLSLNMDAVSEKDAIGHRGRQCANIRGRSAS